MELIKVLIHQRQSLGDKKVSFSLYYDADTSYLFINWKEIFKQNW